MAGYQNHVPTPVDANQLAAAMARLVAREPRLTSLLGFGLGLGFGLPVLRRLRARLDSFKIRIDPAPARRVIGLLNGDLLPAGQFLFLTFLALALALALLLRGSRFVHGAIV